MCAQHRVSLSFRLITLIVARMVMMINMIMTRMMGMLTRMRIFSFRRVHPSEVDGCNNASTLPLIKDPGINWSEQKFPIMIERALAYRLYRPLVKFHIKVKVPVNF